MDRAILKLKLQIVIKPPNLGGFDEVQVARAGGFKGHTGHSHHQRFETFLGLILGVRGAVIIGERWDIMLTIPSISSGGHAVGRGGAAENGGPPCHRCSTTGQC